MNDLANFFMPITNILDIYNKTKFLQKVSISGTTNRIVLLNANTMMAITWQNFVYLLYINPQQNNDVINTKIGWDLEPSLISGTLTKPYTVKFI